MRQSLEYLALRDAFLKKASPNYPTNTYPDANIYDDYYEPYNPYQYLFNATRMEKQASINDVIHELDIEKKASLMINTCLDRGLTKIAAAVRFLQLDEFHPYGYEYDCLTDFLVKEAKSGRQKREEYLRKKVNKSLASRQAQIAKSQGVKTVTDAVSNSKLNDKELEAIGERMFKQEQAAREAKELMYAPEAQQIWNGILGVKGPIDTAAHTAKQKELLETFSKGLSNTTPEVTKAVTNAAPEVTKAVTNAAPEVTKAVAETAPTAGALWKALLTHAKGPVGFPITLGAAGLLGGGLGAGITSAFSGE